MNTQFDNENIEVPPNNNKKYLCYCDDVNDYVFSKGFTHLMKLVLCAKNYKTINLINNILINKPDELNKKNKRGWTALILAAKNINTVSSSEIVKLLLNHPKIDITTPNDGNILIYMCFDVEITERNIDIFKLLINHPKVNVNKQNQFGQTALMYLYQKKFSDLNYELIKIILENNDIKNLCHGNIFDYLYLYDIGTIMRRLYNENKFNAAIKLLDINVLEDNITNSLKKIANIRLNFHNILKVNYCDVRFIF